MKIFVFDIFRFVKKLRLQKIWNAILLWSSYQISRRRKRPVHWGQPIGIAIEPTTACNLRCPECPSGLRAFTRPTGNLKEDFFRTMIEQLAPGLMSLTFYFQGEPYINPNFLDMVSLAGQRGVYTVTSTNGHFLTRENCHRTIDSGLDRLIISIDGSTQEVYQQYRKEGQLYTVLEGARTLVEARRQRNVHHPHIIFQCLVVAPNEHQIPDIYRLAREIGVDEVRLKTAQLYDFKNGHPLMPKNEKYSRYRRLENGLYTHKSALENACWKMWHSAVITWDGKVVPCCFDKDAQNPLGDLKKQSFREIWKSPPTRNFRERLWTGRSEIEMCSNCSEGCSLWA